MGSWATGDTVGVMTLASEIAFSGVFSGLLGRFSVGGGGEPIRSSPEYSKPVSLYITSVVQEVHVCTSDEDFRWQDSERESEKSVKSGTNSATIAPIAPIAHWIQPVIQSA